MTRSGVAATLTASVLAGLVGFVGDGSANRARADAPREQAPEPHAAPKPRLPASAIEALLQANNWVPPKTGEQLWKTLNKLGKFAQLPIVYSAVRLDSSLFNPRVVIAPVVTGLSEQGAADLNLSGRLFLAANMERDPKGGDPRVTSVEFIAWNTLRRKFDFGVIEGMGGSGEPELKVVEGGRCFTCHKNRGPILSAGPWTNSTHHSGLRGLIEEGFKLVPEVTRNTPPGARDRIDGMALVAPEAQLVDNAVRIGNLIRLNRETFQLMNRSAGGRKAFVTMLVTITHPNDLDAEEPETKRAVDLWASDPSFGRFRESWQSLAKTTNTGILIDFAPFPRQLYEWTGIVLVRPKPVPLPPSNGFRSREEESLFKLRVANIEGENYMNARFAMENRLMFSQYEAARAAGAHGMPSSAQPSNPRAFVAPQAKPMPTPSGMVNSVMLAATIGLTKSDRQFLARQLTLAEEAINKPKVTANVLAKAVFEGPEFAEVLAGGPLPDRDEFKDRFVAGLGKLLFLKYPSAKVEAVERREYASGPEYDAALALEAEVVAVPTTACLRCHEVRASGKRGAFEPIPPLAFDPLDKAGREAWAHGTNKARKEEVLSRLQARLYKDADMPPQDSPEHGKFPVKGPAFDELKRFLEAELPPPPKPKAKP